MGKNILLMISALVVISACKKSEEIDVPVIVQQVSDGSLTDVFYLNDSVGIACGGIENIEGQIFKVNSSVWSKVYSNSNYRINTVYSSPSGKMYAGGDFVRLLNSFDQGNSWSNDWLDPSEQSYHEIDRVSIDKFAFINDTIGFFIGGDRYEHGHIYKTTDNGDIWTFDTLKHEISGISVLSENSILFSGYGYIGSTYDQGENISQLPSKSDNFIGIHAISMFNYVAIGNSGKIYRSTNQGEGWHKIAKLKNANIVDTEFSHNLLFAIGSDGGCFYSKDLGESWKSIKLNTTAQINGISLAGQYLNLAGSDGNVYRIIIADIN